MVVFYVIIIGFTRKLLSSAAKVGQMQQIRANIITDKKTFFTYLHHNYHFL